MEFGGTCDPQDAGLDAARLVEAVELVEARGAAAQLCVIRHGQVVVDLSFRCTPDGLFWLFSASKPYLAVVVHHLVEIGRLHLDDAVAAYWPEFGENGKRDITVRHMLQHRSGLSTAGSYLGEVARWPTGSVRCGGSRRPSSGGRSARSRTVRWPSASSSPRSPGAAAGSLTRSWYVEPFSTRSPSSTPTSDCPRSCGDDTFRSARQDRPARSSSRW